MFDEKYRPVHVACIDPPLQLSGTTMSATTVRGTPFSWPVTKYRVPPR